jgi:hypothetical protein
MHIMSSALPENTEPFEPHLRKKEADEQTHKDLMYLAARLLHRGAQTEDEAQAASYIHGRFRERTPDVFKDSFTSIDNPLYLFASYYAEFLFVCLIAFWVPAGAAVYGAAVFGCYLAEFLGFNVLSRFLMQYETQNVVGRFLAPRPKAVFIVTANYDSGCASPITQDDRVRWLRPIHLLVLASMALIIATCSAETVAAYNGAEAGLIPYARGIALLVLLAAAGMMFYASGNTEEVRGANCNASGVCALLRLADRIAKEPLETADVWLVATGSNESWMSGMRHALTSSSLDKPRTYVLNLESLGAGDLVFTTSEGMLLDMPCSRRMVDAAKSVAAPFPVKEGSLRAVPSATQMALARGFSAMSIIGLDEHGCPPRWNSVSDLITGVDRGQILQAADFAEATLRELARRVDI